MPMVLTSRHSGEINIILLLQKLLENTRLLLKKLKKVFLSYILEIIKSIS